MDRESKASIPSACAVELHSNQPEKLVQFYEQTLGVKFRSTAYPFRRYSARLGRFALIIGDARGRDADTASEPGKITLALMSPGEISPDERKFFLPHSRPLGSALPERLATRLQDPDGNYVALAPSLEGVVGVVPWFSTWREFRSSVKEALLLWIAQTGKHLRRRIEGWIDRCEMATNRVTFTRRDLRGYTHFIAARTGLYAINPTSYKRVLRGRFFGITVKDGDVYAFQAIGEHEAGSNKNGRIVKLTIRNDRVEKVRVVAKGLDSGCHQIDFIGEDLLVVDCYNGSIVKIRPDSDEEPKSYYPLGNMSRVEARDKYHMNSIAGHPDGTLWLMLHNGGNERSEIVVLDRQFEVVRRFSVDAAAAHNIVFTNDESEYLIADSLGGRVLSRKGVIIDGGVGMLMVRGLSLDENTCVVGDSVFGSRPFRRFVPGRVHFFDRSTWKLQKTLSVPGAPTDIRRIDGKDMSISNFFAAQAQATAKAPVSPESIAEPEPMVSAAS